MGYWKVSRLDKRSKFSAFLRAFYATYCTQSKALQARCASQIPQES
ncbi:hypothetical protein HMPREF6745_1305 [Prevotella sp. oral taxon 472 str. F0295]|nr:hypothetical protein HMPREF6745_1305 [Prevotella sp. oral taxon 472 str. F0295]